MRTVFIRDSDKKAVKSSTETILPNLNDEVVMKNKNWVVVAPNSIHPRKGVIYVTVQVVP